MYQQQYDTNPSCRQPLTQFVQFTPSYAPPIPNVQGLPPEIGQAIAFIAIEAANAATRAAQVNPIYMFYFNVVSQQGWRNGHFEQLVDMTARYTWLLLEQRAASSIQQAIQDAATQCASISASILAMQNPQLQQCVDPNLWVSAAQVAQKLTSLQTQFMGLGQRVASVQQQQQVYGGGQPTYGGVAVPSFQAARAAAGVFGNGGQPQDNSVTVDPLGTGATVYRARAAAGARQVREFQQEHKYSGIRVPDAVQDVEVKEAPAAKVMNLSPNDGVKNYEVPQFGLSQDAQPAQSTQWIPTPNQLFEPAIDTNTQKLVYEQVRKPGTHNTYITAFATDKTQEEIQAMNRADHVITTARKLYQTRVPEGVPTRISGVSQDLELAAKAVIATASKETDETTETFRNLNLVMLEDAVVPKESLTGVVSTARMQRVVHQQDSQRRAFSTIGSLITYFVTPVTFSEVLFAELKSAQTLSQVGEKLRNFSKAYESGDVAALVWRIDRFLTSRLIHVIRRRLGLHEFSFDSVMDDIDEVFAVLEKDWGVAYSRALRNYQREFIELFFGANLSYVEIDNTEVRVPVTEVPVTVTLVDADAAEFGVVVPGDKSYEVFPSNFPGFYEFIDAIVSTSQNAHHHYVVTEDDVVYEVSKSLVGNKVLLVSNGPKI